MDSELVAVAETTSNRICTLLKDLEQESSSSEYRYQLKRTSDFERCFRSVESLYAQIYSQIISIERTFKHNT
jgi:hypothetical protein